MHGTIVRTYLCAPRLANWTPCCTGGTNTHNWRVVCVRVNAIAIAMSSYSVVRHVNHGASSRRDRELKYSSQPIAKNQATMTPKAWISTGDSSLCGHLLKTLKLMTVPLTHRRSNCAKASLYKKMTPQLLNVKLGGSPKRKAYSYNNIIAT